MMSAGLDDMDTSSKKYDLRDELLKKGTYERNFSNDDESKCDQDETGSLWTVKKEYFSLNHFHWIQSWYRAYRAFGDVINPVA